jgi:uncharacterized protein involved in response to NO
MNAKPPGGSKPVLFSYGFRPFFLAAGVWSATALVIWIVMLETGLTLPSRFDPLTWHIHEMLFGFVMAAIAGFLLTAIANWTQRPAISGGLLAVLAAAWLLGRIACLVSLLLPPWLVIAADLLFPVLLITALGHEVIAARNWRNLPIIAPVVVFAIANLLMHLEAYNFVALGGLGWRLALAAVITLISVVAGRIVPVFTANWLATHGKAASSMSQGIAGRVALGVLHTGLLAWVFFPNSYFTGGLLILGAAFNLVRLWRWRGYQTTSEPLLLSLHIGYGWLVLGVALLGLSTFGIAVPQSAAIHSLTAGAIGTMILAVMTRVTRGHTGRKLSADRATEVMYGLVTLAAIARVVAAFGIMTSMLLIASAVLWIGAFVLFILVYGPMMLRPRFDAAAV